MTSRYTRGQTIGQVNNPVYPWNKTAPARERHRPFSSNFSPLRFPLVQS